jgi:hypothetical protein
VEEGGGRVDTEEIVGRAANKEQFRFFAKDVEGMVNNVADKTKGKEDSVEDNIPLTSCWLSPLHTTTDLGDITAIGGWLNLDGWITIFEPIEVVWWEVDDFAFLRALEGILEGVRDVCDADDEVKASSNGDEHSESRSHEDGGGGVLKVDALDLGPTIGAVTRTVGPDVVGHCFDKRGHDGTKDSSVVGEGRTREGDSKEAKVGVLVVLCVSTMYPVIPVFAGEGGTKMGWDLRLVERVNFVAMD